MLTEARPSFYMHAHLEGACREIDAIRAYPAITTCSKSDWQDIYCHKAKLSFSTTQRIGDYIVTSQCLGTGSFATVHLAIDPIRHRQVACKSIRTKRDHEVAQVMKEVRLLMTFKHARRRIFLPVSRSL